MVNPVNNTSADRLGLWRRRDRKSPLVCIGKDKHFLQ